MTASRVLGEVDHLAVRAGRDHDLVLTAHVHRDQGDAGRVLLERAQARAVDRLGLELRAGRGALARPPRPPRGARRVPRPAPPRPPGSRPCLPGAGRTCRRRSSVPVSAGVTPVTTRSTFTAPTTASGPGLTPGPPPASGGAPPSCPTTTGASTLVATRAFSARGQSDQGLLRIASMSVTVSPRVQRPSSSTCTRVSSHVHTAASSAAMSASGSCMHAPSYRPVEA